MTLDVRASIGFVILIMLGFGEAASNCNELLTAANGQLSSGSYTVTNTNQQSFKVYCQFYNGYGYAFVSKNTDVTVDMSSLRDDTSHVVIRHKRANGRQYTATMEQLSRYSSTPILVQYNGHSGYNRPQNYVMTPYIYVGFVPQSLTSRGATHGWKCNGKEYTFSNCDANANSYIVFLFNHNNRGYTSYQGYYNALMFPWYDKATILSTSENLPDEFFSSIYEIHHGGCGGYGTGRAVSDITGATVGVKFTITCAAPSQISQGSMTYTGMSVGSTASFSCSSGYSVISGDATRTCSGTGGWSGSEPVCGVHGNWADWSNWSGCSVTCASGTKTRSRTCTDPAPVNGNACAGSGTDSAACTLSACPIDGNWATWSSWSTCTLTCGTGTQSRSRTCSDPSAQHGGADCAGDGDEAQNCNTQSCPIDGNWATWSSWSTCTLTCGAGTQSRSRTCSDPSAQHGGADCAGDGDEAQNCNTQSCPIDGNWAAWSSWSTCSLTCGTGTQSRSRTCSDPSAQHGGADCAGDGDEAQNCNTHNCPIDGGWTQWSAWTACGVTCSDSPVISSRGRTCTNPSPQYNGANCSGDAAETNDCNLNPCPIDGQWSSWNAYGECSVTCLGGIKNRTRDCGSPAPNWGGADCVGDAWETDSCNDNACNVLPPVDGNWGAWADWNGCSVTCDSGIRRRYRACDSPAPARMGEPCQGEQYTEEVCTAQGTCPVSIDGNWGEWSNVSSCDVTCGTGQSVRARQCDNPAPSNGGQACDGLSLTVSTCVLSDCDSSNSSSGYGQNYKNVCPLGYFTCYSGGITCLSEAFVCECTSDCDDGSDESIEWAGCEILCSGVTGMRGISGFGSMLLVIFHLVKRTIFA